MTILVILILYLSTKSESRKLEARDFAVVGTALFTEEDLRTTCWKSEGLLLLDARIAFQTLIPRPVNISTFRIIMEQGSSVRTKEILLNADKENFVNPLVEYMRVSRDTIRKRTSDRVRDIMEIALTDAFGGYMRTYLMPLVKQKYYAGQMTFEEAKLLSDIYYQFKLTLKQCIRFCSDEVLYSRWASPVQVPMCSGVRPYDLRLDVSGDPCSELIITENPGVGSGVQIPMPFFDSPRDPDSIAIPVKPYALYNLRCPSAGKVLEKYYITSLKCLISRSATQQEVLDFNRNYYNFIRCHIYPLLASPRWYPALGGILRTVVTMKELGIPVDCTRLSASDVQGNIAGMSRKGASIVPGWDNGAGLQEASADNIGSAPGERNGLTVGVMIIIAIVIAVVLIGVIFLLKCFGKKPRPLPPVLRPENCPCRDIEQEVEEDVPPDDSPDNSMVEMTYHEGESTSQQSGTTEGTGAAALRSR